MRTLAIASTASASAALLTSQLWFRGTWIAAALTPVIVTLVSELLYRPTERIASKLTSERPSLSWPKRTTPPPPAPTRRSGHPRRTGARLSQLERSSAQA